MNSTTDKANQTAELVAWLKSAQEHLRSYRKYSDEMCKLGRGHSPSSQFSPEYLDAGIEQAIAKASNVAAYPGGRW